MTDLDAQRAYLEALIAKLETSRYETAAGYSNTEKAYRHGWNDALMYALRLARG